MTPEQERKVDELTGGVGQVNKQLTDLRRKARRRTQILSAALAVALLVALWATHVAREAQSDLHTSVSNTATARVESCKNSNHDKISGAHKDIRLSHDTVLALVHTSGSSASAHAAALSTAHSFNVKHDALIRKSYARRDCSPEGIARYLGIPAHAS